ncbi:MAG: NADAR family protein [Gammaproteobacteria bacterium]|nr:NADAR family protein [Gammaproteobacteria bacterium]
MAIEFSSKTSEYSELSNFYYSPFILRGVWPTVEHYFQAQKFPGDPDLQEKIRKTEYPSIAKKLGRTRSPHFRRDWESVKEMVMLEALQAKFDQNPDLATILKNTGTALLKEKAAWDSYWGTGKNGNGRNRMGELLMIVRASL